MPTEEFERHKMALAVRRQEKPKQLSHRALRYWGEITSGEYFFDRDDVEVDDLHGIQHSHLMEFFQQFVFHDAYQRRKISVHVLSNVPQEKAETGAQNGLPPPPPCMPQPELVQDVAVFKSSLPLYSLVQPRPITCVSSAGAKAKL